MAKNPSPAPGGRTRTPKPKPQLADDVIKLLRRRLKEAQAEISSLDKANRGHELHRSRLELKASSAQRQFEALFEAVRELAKHVPNSTVEARKSREAARKLIEGVGLTPPRSLGSSRSPRKKKRKPRKKKT